MSAEPGRKVSGNRLRFRLEIKQLNPNQYHFAGITVTETEWEWWDNPDYKAIVGKIPDVWFLTQEGSYLSNKMGKTETEIAVDETQRNGVSLFEKGDTVACGYESMKVTAVDHDAKTLTVERGFHRKTETHPAGARIASHVTFWPKSWVMNLSTQCPKHSVDGGPEEQWIDWAVRDFVPVLFPKYRDGFLIDRIEKSQSSMLIPSCARNIDPTCENEIPEDYKAFDNAWFTGISQVLADLRTRYGNVLFGNSFGAYYELLNGSIYESCPGNWSDTKPETYGDWKEKILGTEGYIEVSNKGYSPNFSFLETYEIEEYMDPDANPFLKPDFTPNYQRMRWGLTSALLGDGYFSYEINTNGHGCLGLMWFDEYDNAGVKKGYLGYPKSESRVILDYGSDGKVFRRDYDNGIVLCNPSERTASILLERPYRLISGTQDQKVNSGSTVDSVSILPKDGRILLLIIAYVNKDDGTCNNNNPCYTSIQEAINTMDTGADIRISQGTYAESITLNTSKALTLQGGWDSSFSSQAPNTTILKAPKVRWGSLKGC